MNLTAKNKGFEIFTRPALASGGVEPTRKVARLIRHGEIIGGTVALVDQGPRHGPALARRYEICAWLDTKMTGRWPRLIVGGLLGLAAFFLFPIILGLFS
jgi:hypothetical protein